MKVTNCRSCGAEIVWVRLMPTGARAPVDAQTDLDGNLLLEEAAIAGDPPTAVLVSRARAAELVGTKPLFRSHFASCPQAEQWRKRPQGVRS
jgi:hypothetical protein